MLPRNLKCKAVVCAFSCSYIFRLSTSTPVTFSLYFCSFALAYFYYFCEVFKYSLFLQVQASICCNKGKSFQRLARLKKYTGRKLREYVIQTTDSLIFQSFRLEFVTLLKLSFCIINFVLKQYARFTADGTHLFLS